MINLIIADDHNVFREGIISFFDESNEIQIVGEACNGEELLNILPGKNVDVILLDISMPVLDGVEASKEIKRRYPDVKIIMLTMHDTQNYVRNLLEIGVDGYLLKTTSKSELIEAVTAVMNGETFYGEDVKKIFMDSFNAEKVVSAVKLTKREKQVLELICEEYSTTEIADSLFISTHTVESHRKNLLNKTGAKNVAGLVKFAMQNKFI